MATMYCYIVSYDLDKADYTTTQKGKGDKALRDALDAARFDQELESQWFKKSSTSIDVKKLRTRLLKVLVSPDSEIIVRQVSCKNVAP